MSREKAMTRVPVPAGVPAARRMPAATAVPAVMKALAVLAVGSALLAPACGGCRRSEEPLVLTAPWASGEVSRLEVASSVTGAHIADWSMSISADGGEWVFTNETSVPGSKEVSTIRASRETLVPSRAEHIVESPQVTATVTGVYGDKLTIAGTVNGEPQELTVELPVPPYFDNEQVVAVLRALPLADGWRGTLNIVGSKSVLKLQLRVGVAGREEVTTPAGTFTCWKIDLTGMAQTAWVNVDPPHQLVQYENRAAQTLSRLVDFTPGQ